jgi:plasmid stabilization system protein ParE
MSRRLVVRARARFAIAEAVEWYEARTDALSEDFVSAVEQAMATIAHNPFQYQKVHGELRRVGLQRFPYSLIYVATDDEVIVLTCVHNVRDPRRWQDLG